MPSTTYFQSRAIGDTYSAYVPIEAAAWRRSVRMVASLVGVVVGRIYPSDSRAGHQGRHA
jgi:hypothetical protein